MLRGGVLNGLSRASGQRHRRLMSVWKDVPKGPEDAILGVTIAYNKDENPKKINLGVGAYRDDNGKPFVLSSVRAAEARIQSEKRPMEYLPVIGDKEFLSNSLKLAFTEDNEFLKNDLIASIQALSGTGACRLGAEFISRFHKSSTGMPLVLMPSPTWANHPGIFRDGGCEVGKYRYYDPDSCGFDLEGCVEDLKSAPVGSVVLLHACAHNPTGVDPTMDQWEVLSETIKRAGLLPFFDMAYQGFTSGSLDIDAGAVRKFVEDGHRVMLAQSFSKNFGLYGHRLGTLSMLTDSDKEKMAIESQLKILARTIWSNPPIQGSRIVNEVFKDNSFYNSWTEEMSRMANRIIDMRKQLSDKLVELKNPRDWSHITRQKGMFCYSGLSPAQVEAMKEQFSVYLISSGRISMAGVTSANVEHLATAMDAVTK
ncbi:hypothetical protein NDN08_000928 [Rhodosorus marinus]|uniref:Aspartate aminotransferase n=1 Tax=Rhodosorus marinus TaxID=101924 RepID=A0AAV8UPD9_9RHOD|nr:hypothetical protein NDN08_000928 [Rhodosorus marinus]